MASKKNTALSHDFERGWSLLADEDEKAAIGAALRQGRKRSGDLTLDQLSRLTALLDPSAQGISRVALSRYETGAAYPGVREIKLLARALRMRLSSLLYQQTDDPMNFRPISVEQAIDEAVYRVLVGQGLVKDDSPQGPREDGYDDLLALVKTKSEE
jgi:transcriptional regulator with XRE-family HTH domain